MPGNPAALKQRMEAGLATKTAGSTRSLLPGSGFFLARWPPLAAGTRGAQDKKMGDQAQAAAHWDAAYTQGDDTRSWSEQHPDTSPRMLDSAIVSAADALIDVGGGASPLTRALLYLGFGDFTVLDISAAGTHTHATSSFGGLTRFTG